MYIAVINSSYSIFVYFEHDILYAYLVNHILLDESGDLGFKLGRGSSKFFVVTIVFVSSKRTLEKIARIVHRELGKKFKKVGTLHAYQETPVTRTRILRKLNEHDCSILAIVLNKQKVYTNLQDEKPVLYNFVTNILLDRFFKKKPVSLDKPTTLIASRRETNKFLNQNFKDYLQTQTLSNRAVKLNIALSTPAREKSLQVVDFASWAIFRKYEYGDDSYYNLIKSKIIEEAPLFP